MGSALVMMLSMRLAEMPWSPIGGHYNINVDPGRIAYGVMTGMGFLGAGAILKHEQTVRGLTTAAGLWCVAAVGLTVGMGLYQLATLSGSLVLVALWALYYIERWIPRQHLRRLVVRCKWAEGAVAALDGTMRQSGLDVLDHSFKRSADLTHADVEFSVAFYNSRKLRDAEAKLASDPNYELMASLPE